MGLFYTDMASYRILLWLVLLTFLMDRAVCGKMNVLFLVADDMRPELGAYTGGPDFPSPVHPKMHTPNLDALAGRSLLLKRSYCQQAECNPSRTSLLTGRRPDTTHVYDLVTCWRDVGGNFTTIPQYFKDNGYLSVGMGKVFHPGPASKHDDPISWSLPYYHSPEVGHWFEQHNSWIAVTAEQEAKNPLPDVQIADKAVATLKWLADPGNTADKPFFLAVGFHKPHLPFVFPKPFLDYYPEEDIHLPDNPYAPVGMPAVAWNRFFELRDYDDIARLHNKGYINETLPDKTVLQLRRAYYSAVSYTDHLVGRVLGELSRLGLDNNTIVSFWGDHGWQLGEHGEWAKYTNFELATHAPMMVSLPGITDKGVVSEQLTEFVDLFPTLVEAAGLPSLPLCPENSTSVEVCTEGISMVPLMRDPKASWKDMAFSQYPRNGTDIMGYTLRTDQYRYTEWAKFRSAPEYKPDWTTLYGVELYDHQADPEENINRDDDQSYQGIKAHLSQLLRQGWRAAVPYSMR